jgi:hypothetical protein
MSFLPAEGKSIRVQILARAAKKQSAVTRQAAAAQKNTEILGRGANIYEALKNYDCAQTLFENALAISAEQSGQQDSADAAGLVKIGDLSPKRRQYDEADAFYEGSPKSLEFPRSRRFNPLPVAASAQVTTRREGANSGAHTPAVRVWVIDTAHIDKKTLSDAQKTTTGVFRNVGLRVIWFSCPSRTGQPGSARCQYEDASALVLRIVPRPAGNSVDGDALGFAVVTPGNSTYATVFRERVLAALDPAGPCTEAVLLGHAIAHELGHLLLGTSSHTRAGLMAGRWHATALDHAASGWLQFSPSEAARMRAEATRRAREADASGTNRPDHQSRNGPS